jgi:hypothetical protein
MSGEMLCNSDVTVVCYVSFSGREFDIIDQQVFNREQESLFGQIVFRVLICVLVDTRK